MKTSTSIGDISLAVKPAPQVPNESKHQAWIELWWKNWSYTQWLLSSMITSVIATEVYTILLSIYPNFMLNLWMSIGLTSITLSTVLTYGLILGAGLFTGWLIYSAHLAFVSIRAANKDYQPLIELWTQFNQDSSTTITALLHDDNFLKLSKFLSAHPLPEPIKAFLTNKGNLNGITKLVDLLKKIWSLDNIEEKIKTLTLDVLSQCASDTNHEERIENISSLCHLLIETNQFNHEMVTKTLENSEQFNPYLAQLKSLKHKDLLQKLIEEPKLMAFYTAMQDVFKDDPERITRNTESIYYHLRFDLTNTATLSKFKTQFTNAEQMLVVSPQIYQWLKQDYFSQPDVFVSLWNQFAHHPYPQWIRPIFEFMTANDKYRPLLMNKLACQALLDVFNRPSLISEPNYLQISQSVTDFTKQGQYAMLCDILLYLQNTPALNTKVIEKLIQNDNIHFLHQAIQTSPLHLSPENLEYASEHGRFKPAPPMAPTEKEKKSILKGLGCFSSNKKGNNEKKEPLVVRASP